jgi:mannose/fructose/N-acetylgalactosamine-specific phosphotransferase system component IIC
MFLFAMACVILGSMLEAAGVLCLSLPQLKFMIPRFVATGLVVLGGLLVAAGILLLIAPRPVAMQA